MVSFSGFLLLLLYCHNRFEPNHTLKNEPYFAVGVDCLFSQHTGVVTLMFYPPPNVRVHAAVPMLGYTWLPRFRVRHSLPRLFRVTFGREGRVERDKPMSCVSLCGSWQAHDVITCRKLRRAVLPAGRKKGPLFWRSALLKPRKGYYKFQINCFFSTQNKIFSIGYLRRNHTCRKSF